MNNTINDSTISFHAKLKISGLGSGNSKKMRKVAKIFETKTSDYPKDSMHVLSNEFSYKKHYVSFDNDEDFANLLNLPNKKLAIKLVKLFKGFKKAENITKEATEINKSLLKNGLRQGFGDYYSNLHNVDNFKDSVSTLLFYLEKCSFNKFVQNDPILKNAHYLGTCEGRFKNIT